MFYQSKSQSSHNGLQGPTSSAPSSFHYLSVFSPLPHPLTDAAPGLPGSLVVPGTQQAQGLRTGSFLCLEQPNFFNHVQVFAQMFFSRRDLPCPPYLRLQSLLSALPAPQTPLILLYFFICSTYHLLSYYQACWLFCVSHAMIHISEGRNTSVPSTDDTQVPKQVPSTQKTQAMNVERMNNELGQNEELVHCLRPAN